MNGIRAAAVSLVALASCACSSPVDVSKVDVRVSISAAGTSTSEGRSLSTAPPKVSSSAPRPSTISSSSITVTPLENSWPRAVDVLGLLVVAPEFSSGYQREFFPHWSVSNGCSTRERVLIDESTSFAQVDPFGCRVVAGDWLSLFDGRTWDDPAELQIDHLVALKEAWESGAWAWTENQRRSFANDMKDPRPLNAVTGSVNQSKSDLDPADWLPPLEGARCGYIADWIAVKARWQLSIDGRERDAMARYLKTNCSDQRIAPWETQAVSAPTSVNSSPPPVTVNTDGGTSGSVYYANCTEARAAGAAPILVGEPGYRVAMDRDQDGIACE